MKVRMWLVRAAVGTYLVLIFVLDSTTGEAPFQHLYYLPIVWAGVTMSRRAGPIVGAIAVVLYHLANPALLQASYREADIVQISLFLAIGFVTSKLADDRRRLRRLADTDDLTGLYNLRGFNTRLSHAIRLARESRSPIALLVLDVDRLKSINDSHGHSAGADAVRTVGTLLAARLPAGAFACRFGGDEFVVALPGQEAGEASATAGQLRDAVNGEAPSLAGVAYPRGTLSISIGVACAARVDSSTASVRSDDEVAEDLFKAADAALYAAKAGGRNQVHVG
jgi:diguanylate cyclase (GGDEF)-like protein